jgi:hypothetical protein
MNGAAFNHQVPPDFRPAPLGAPEYPRVRLKPDAPLIDNIARLIGAGAASRLVAEFGGGRLYIPEKPSPGDRLTEAIGYVAAMRLASVFGGERVSLPLDSGRALSVRIAELRARGVSIARIARRAGCSERYVYKVLARLRDE